MPTHVLKLTLLCPRVLVADNSCSGQSQDNWTLLQQIKCTYKGVGNCYPYGAEVSEAQGNHTA